MELASPAPAGGGQSVTTLLEGFDKLDADGDGQLNLKAEVKDWLPRSASGLWCVERGIFLTF